MTPHPNITVHVRNLRALELVRWKPRGVCALVGANGSGKTTLLLVLKLLRAALETDLPSAVAGVLGGSFELARRGAAAEPIEVGLDVDDLSWRVRLIPQGATVASRTQETLLRGDERIIDAQPVGKALHRGNEFEPSERLALARVLSLATHDEEVKRVADAIRSITVFHDLDLWALRRGSDSVVDQRLDDRGVNAITMLRRWSQERPHRHRYNFVLGGLREAFPELVHDMDFESAGRTLVTRFYPPPQPLGQERPNALATEANGVLALLVLLCAIAGSEDGGLVAIDEPETALHPFAIRRFVDVARKWADQHGQTVLLSTHSPALLNELTSEPGQVFVMRRGEGSTPVPLDELKNPEWLRQFSLGELQLTDALCTNAGQHAR